MFDASFFDIHSLVAQYGILAVFLAGFLEEIFFFIPSSLVFIGLGFFLIDPQISFMSAAYSAFFTISLTTALGVTLGALIMYSLPYWGGKPFIERYGKYARVSWHDLMRFEQWFERGYRDEIILIFFRAIPVFPITIISLFCGLLRISVIKFIWTTFAGTTIRIFTLALLGWYVGTEYEHYATQIIGLERYGIILFLVLLVAFVWYFYSAPQN